MTYKPPAPVKMISGASTAWSTTPQLPGGALRASGRGGIEIPSLSAPGTEKVEESYQAGIPAGDVVDVEKPRGSNLVSSNGGWATTTENDRRPLCAAKHAPSTARGPGYQFSSAQETTRLRFGPSSGPPAGGSHAHHWHSSSRGLRR